MAASKKVVEPQDAVLSEPAPVATEAAPVRETVRFWKAVNPFEKIVFKDGTSLVFSRQTFATADEELIKKIDEVSGYYKIFRQ